jgi:phosphatidylserine/phosphatidylglycerophosphate/cardiolipin synthase-like enzyme
MNHNLQFCRAVLLFAAATTAAANAGEIEIYFSPNGSAAAAVAKEIDAAKTSVHVLAYAISEDRITRALIAANNRGLEVRLIVDRHEQDGRYSSAQKIKKAGVPTTVDRAHTLMHNKTMVIDSTIVITGSMNFTASGDRQNAENTLVLRDPDAAKIYEEDFNKHLNHSPTFTPSTLPASIPPPPTNKEPH